MVRTRTNTEPIAPTAKITSNNLIAVVISKSITVRLALAARPKSGPYELFTNFLADSYGLCNPMELDGCDWMPDEDGFGYGCSDFCRDNNSGSDFSSLF